MRRLYVLICLCVLLFPLHVDGKSRQQLWVIDAGHGGYDVGCEGSKTKEKYITLTIARRVADLLRGALPGVKVRLTRDSDRFLSLQQRTEIANQAGADLFVSIHVNSAPEASGVRGTETYYGPVGATNIPSVERARKNHAVRSELLAWCMQKQYGLVGRPISRGVKRERYYVVLHTLMPSILTEVGFISNASDQNYMMSATGQEEIAQCIYRGLLDYYNYVQSGREKRTLAQMRNTGGKPTKQEMEAFAAQQKQQKQEPAVSTQVAEPVVAQAKGKNQPEGKNQLEGKNGSSAQTTTVPEKKPDVAETKPQTKAEAEAEAKAEAAVVLDKSLEPELEQGELRFCIQVFALKTRIAVTDPRLKGLKDVEIMEKDGKYKYLCGSTDNYQYARKQLEEVRKNFPDAFLVAFLGKRQISTADAQEMVTGKN